jgi:hypothetical protein
MDKEKVIYENLFFIVGTVLYQLFSSTQNGGRKRAQTKRRRLGRRRKRYSGRTRNKSYRGGVIIQSIVTLFAVLLALVSVILQGGNLNELFQETNEMKRVIIQNEWAPSFMLNMSNNSLVSDGSLELENYTYSPIQFYGSNSGAANMLISGIERLLGPQIFQNKKFLQVFKDVEKYNISPGSNEMKQLANSSNLMLLSDGEFNSSGELEGNTNLVSSDQNYDSFTQQVAYFVKKAENMSTTDMVFYSLKLVGMAMLNANNMSILSEINDNLDNAYLAETDNSSQSRELVSYIEKNYPIEMMEKNYPIENYDEEDKKFAKIFKNVYEMQYGEKRKKETNNFDIKKLIYVFATIFSVYLGRQKLQRQRNVEQAEEIMEEKEAEGEGEGEGEGEYPSFDNFSTTAVFEDAADDEPPRNNSKKSFFGCSTSEFENVRNEQEAKGMHKKCCTRNLKNMFSSKRQNNCTKLEQQYSINGNNSMGGRRKTKTKRRRRHY